MTISFKYKNVKLPDGTLVKTPAIPKSIAELLGLNLDSKITSAYGIGGKAN